MLDMLVRAEFQDGDYIQFCRGIGKILISRSRINGKYHILRARIVEKTEKKVVFEARNPITRYWCRITIGHSGPLAFNAPQMWFKPESSARDLSTMAYKPTTRIEYVARDGWVIFLP